MQTMNKIILLGRIAKDPELTYSQGGTAVCKFSLAVTRENDKNKADFFYCTAFGKLAQSIVDYCPKGRQILMEGRIEINTVNDQYNNTKTYVNVITHSAQFLALPQNKQEQTPPQQQYQQQPNFQLQQPAYQPSQTQTYHQDQRQQHMNEVMHNFGNNN